MFVFCGFMMRFLLRDLVWTWLGSDELEGLAGLTDLQYKHIFIENNILLYNIFFNSSLFSQWDFCKDFLTLYSKQGKLKLSSAPARIKINIDFLETSSLLN